MNGPEERRLSNNEIDQYCKSIVEEINEKYPAYRPHIHFLYYYGVRIGEVFNFHIQYDTDTNKLVVYPQKKNNPRYLGLVSEESLKMLEELQLSQNNSYLNKRNLQKIISNCGSYRSVQIGKKNSGAHVFRHNWVKKQVAYGHQFSTIDAMLGYTDQTVKNTYASSIIKY